MNSKKIREYYINNLPNGLFKRDIERMSESDLLDLHHIMNEDDDEIFENADIIQIYNGCTCGICGKTMKPRRR